MTRLGLILAHLAALSAAWAPAQTVSALSPPATQADIAAMQALIPQPSTGAPPGVADAGALGTMAGFYALANHTHASKARKGRILVPVVGSATYADVTFSSAFTVGATPLCAVTAETTVGDANVVNAQIDGVPTATGMRIRVTRTAITAAAVLGVNVLSVPTQVATYAHFICLEP